MWQEKKPLFFCSFQGLEPPPGARRLLRAGAAAGQGLSRRRGEEAAAAAAATAAAAAAWRGRPGQAAAAPHQGSPVRVMRRFLPAEGDGQERRRGRRSCGGGEVVSPYFNH